MKIANFDEDHALALGGSTAVIAQAQADAAITDHVADTSEVHQASGIAILDATDVRYGPLPSLTSGAGLRSGYYGSGNVEGALAEIGGALRVLAGTGVRYGPLPSLTSGPSGAGMTNPMTTAADLIVGGTGGLPTRLAKGADGQVLTVDPTTHLLVWATSSSGFANPMTTKGDLIVGDTGGAAIRKAVGTDGHVLTADAASTGGTKWAAAVATVGVTYPFTKTWATDFPDGVFNWLGTTGQTMMFINPAGGTGAGLWVNAPVFVTATQSTDQDAARTALKALDQGLDATNGCSHTQDVANSWWKVDFGASHTLTVTRLAIVGRNAAGYHPRNFKLQGSTDNSVWTDLLSVAGAGPNDNAWWSSAVTGAAAYRYIRIYETGTNAAGTNHLVIGEVEMWGTMA